MWVPVWNREKKFFQISTRCAFAINAVALLTKKYSLDGLRRQTLFETCPKTKRSKNETMTKVNRARVYRGDLAEVGPSLIPVGLCH